MSGVRRISMDELKTMKFDVIEHFGFSKSKNIFFIMNTKEPFEFGSDCRDHTWYEVTVNYDQLFALKEFIKELFGYGIDVATMKKACNSINRLDRELAKKSPTIDWGACHVTYFPIAPVFQNGGE